MRGVGGPLLCIGDLLSDVGDHHESRSTPSLPSLSILNPTHDEALAPSHIPKLFQENYKQLTEALAGNDHSWTSLTLKLCTALETADKLVKSANSNVGLLSEKVGVLESIVKRGDSAVKASKSVLNEQNSTQKSSIGS